MSSDVNHSKGKQQVEPEVDSQQSRRYGWRGFVYRWEAISKYTGIKISATDDNINFSILPPMVIWRPFVPNYRQKDKGNDG